MARQPTTLILASSSPRRRELLASKGWAFEVIQPPLTEADAGGTDTSPRALAEALAYFKARAVWEARPKAWVLGADTVVARNDEVLGKPAGRRQAEDMLRALSGTRHAVITGAALCGPGPRRLIASDVTYVTMRKMTEEEVAQYLASGEWQGKAGAYAIQETADRFVRRLEGSLSNVVGLPLELVERMLRQVGALPSAGRHR